jgi:hypothetical protein
VIDAPCFNVRPAAGFRKVSAGVIPVILSQSLMRSSPRKRGSQATHTALPLWSPACAGMSGGESAPSPRSLLRKTRVNALAHSSSLRSCRSFGWQAARRRRQASSPLFLATRGRRSSDCRSPIKRGARNAGPHRTRVRQDLAILTQKCVLTRLRRVTRRSARGVGGLLRGHPGGVTIFYPPLSRDRKLEGQYAVP